MPTIPYKIDDERVQGATTIISQNVGWGKNGLSWWHWEQGRKGIEWKNIYKTATVPGTIAHYLIECWLKKKQAKYDPAWSEEDIAKGKTAFDNFLRWSEQFKMAPLEVEPNWVSRAYRFGGTPDLIARVIDRTCLIDWKTGRTYESLFLQLAAYSILAREHGYFLEGYHCLRIPKNEDVPGFHHSYWEVLPDAAESAFHNALALSKHEKVLKTLL